mmetsp:Transcript_18875/g.30590  ORF Transcript_18875/g.30590 Transcript_18875/m.30590 type:complete len:336 (-) Transcript_18875:213-1220(-)|eukprot:CAMPEP_0169126520 /NCGR_PEP_ID=MMETSP1015-20121227/35493_1 /TAXON_ID=342587 /ORGANISM="Karlodinium micrum, Strain CCMP2283" /LENGTH=335 /DNA_ID=CAMNT_0009190191 /DNA_START=71 /DNA_END=1078 /DNA_ORIENTATION=-
MAKLIAHKGYIHAVLGLVALAHFFVRFGALFVLQIDSFKPDVVSFLLYGVHFFLHITSFQFPLPNQRNYSKPMIWPEFRLHNAIFSYRNLLGAVLGTWFPVWWLQTTSVSNVVAKFVLVLGACKAADMTTERLGDKEKRTTNAMPYSESAPESVVKLAKHFYAKSQFTAAALAIFGGPVLAWGSLFALELASVLMTMVRKGYLQAHHYHIWYSFSLFIMFPAMVVSIHCLDDTARLGTLRAMIATPVAIRFRMSNLKLPVVKPALAWTFQKFGMEYESNAKYVAWIFAIPAAYIGAEVMYKFDCVLLSVWLGFAWGIADTLSKVIHPAVLAGHTA